MSTPQKYISGLTETPNEPNMAKKAHNDPKIPQNQKVRKQKIIQNESY